MRPRRRMRRAVFAARRPVRVFRRRVRRRTRRIVRRAGVLLLLAGTTTNIKISKEDVKRIEDDTGKSIEDLNERDIKKAMKNLGIEQIDLTEDDEKAIENFDESEDTKGQFCSQCGAKIAADSNFCTKCGHEIK